MFPSLMSNPQLHSIQWSCVPFSSCSTTVKNKEINGNFQCSIVNKIWAYEISKIIEFYFY